MITKYILLTNDDHQIHFIDKRLITKYILLTNDDHKIHFIDKR